MIGRGASGDGENQELTVTIEEAGPACAEDSYSKEW
jgi:hypothetical protein